MVTFPHTHTHLLGDVAQVLGLEHGGAEVSGGAGQRGAARGRHGGLEAPEGVAKVPAAPEVLQDVHELLGAVHRLRDQRRCEFNYRLDRYVMEVGY